MFSRGRGDTGSVGTTARDTTFTSPCWLGLADALGLADVLGVADGLAEADFAKAFTYAAKLLTSLLAVLSARPGSVSWTATFRMRVFGCGVTLIRLERLLVSVPSLSSVITFCSCS